jgi:3-hydroxybutyryl-CoA dehydrogenase
MAKDANNARIAVIGAGLMGHGIAQVFASAGHAVTITDVDAASLDSALSRITANLRELGGDEGAVARIWSCASLAEAVRDADYVVEAVSENPPLKQKLFAEIERHVRADAILASNTSVIPITSIMQGLATRERALGTHWWNPPCAAGGSDRDALDLAGSDRLDNGFARSGGQTAGACEKDVPGFIGNRLQHALWREAIALVENGICDAETVDAVIKASFGRRLRVLGPLENADLVGTDLTLAIHDIVLPAIDSRPAPSPYLRKLVADGKLGFKSGEGFRKWSPGQQAALRAKVTQHLKSMQSL